MRAHPDLTYAVLMPWVAGETWQEILLDGKVLSPEKSLQLAKSFARMMMALEERRLAHCDLSGPNIIIQSENEPGLVDLEEMYGPGFLEPENLPAGSPGYAHKSAPSGVWNAHSDRFSGAVLLTEMLAWSDSTVRGGAWGESYFSPKDMQGENDRYRVLHAALERLFGNRVPTLFAQAWRSDSLRDCPTFAEWAVALPEKAQVIKTERDVETSAPHRELSGDRDALVLVLEAQKAANQGEVKQALLLYRQAIEQAPPDLSGEIEERIAELEDRLPKTKTAPPREAATSKTEYRARSCLVCGKHISAGQEICPHCEGVPRPPEVETSNLKIGNYWPQTAGIVGILLILLGTVFIVQGRKGIGPFSSLATDTPVPTATSTVTPTYAPTLTYTPTYTPAPTVTPTHAPGDTMLSPKDGMTLVYIPAGAFEMGSEDGSKFESPVHTVYTDAFWMDQHEVTYAQFTQFMEEEGYSAYPYDYGDDHPVVHVDWHDAQAYCEWADRRLPTEAEWEKAARGGLVEKKYPWGDEDPVCTKGAKNGAQYSSCDGRPVPVMSFTPNGYGLYDMAGNVFEWVADWYDSGYYNNTPFENPPGPTSGSSRVLRGGSWRNNGNYVRAAYRSGTIPIRVRLFRLPLRP